MKRVARLAIGGRYVGLNRPLRGDAGTDGSSRSASNSTDEVQPELKGMFETPRQRIHHQPPGKGRKFEEEFYKSTRGGDDINWLSPQSSGLHRSRLRSGDTVDVPRNRILEIFLWVMLFLVVSYEIYSFAALPKKVDEKPSDEKKDEQSAAVATK